MRDRRRTVAIIGIALAVLALRHPTADVSLLTHDAGDPAPHSMKAAIDLGLVGVTFFYTWTQHLR